MGRRVRKATLSGVIYFHYADEGLVGEFDGAGSPVQLYGYQPDATWTTDPVYQKTSEGYAYYQNDHLGMPQQLVQKSGAKVWEGEYRAFGELVSETGAWENRLRFAGQYFDSESNNYYNYFRDYDPTTGRYLQSDPIGLMRDYGDPQLQLAIEQGILEVTGFAGGELNHLYGYVGQNPLYWYDPYGLAKNTNKGIRPTNPNKKPPPPHRIPGGERERNRGHKDGEEHSRTPKGPPNVHREQPSCGENCQKSVVLVFIARVGWVLLNVCTLGAAGS